MSTKIILKKSSVPGKTPLSGNLEYGELAINYADGKLHYKNSLNTISAFIDETSVDSAITAAIAAQDLVDSANVISIFNTAFSGKTTTDLAEGNNKYYTTTRFDSDFGNNTTSDLTEGTNLYYTTARFDSDLTTKTTTDLAEGTNLYYTTARFDTRLGTKTTDNLSEGSTNLYYTNARVETFVDSAYLAVKLPTYVTLTGTQTLTNKTLTDFTLDSTPVYGHQYGSVAINNDTFLGDSTQSVMAFFSSDSSRNSILAIGKENQASHVIGTIGTNASNELVVGLDGTNAGFRIRNNVGQNPINLASGANDLLVVTSGGVVQVKNSTEATTKTTAALVVTGGLGVDKTIRSQDLVVVNNITVGTNGTGKLIGGVTGTVSSIANHTTTNLAEGTNLYYTTARFDTRFSSKTTSNLAEGTNKYYTTNRADSDARYSISATTSGDGSLTYNPVTGVIAYQGPSQAQYMSHLAAGTGVSLDSATGVISIGQPVGTGDSVNFAGGAFTGNLTVYGDLNVVGTQTTSSFADYRVTNSLMKLADSNSNDLVDIGIVGRYSDDGGTTIRRAGFFRDATNGEWYTFDNLIQDGLDSSTPDQTIDRGHASFQKGTWNFGYLRGSYLGFDSDFRVFSTNYQPKTTSFTAVSAGRYAINTSGGSFTVTLPANPSTGDYIKLIDIGNWSVNNLTVARNGSTIEGYADDFQLDIGQNVIEFIYINTTWQVYASIGQRGPQGPAGQNADSADFATNNFSIAMAIALG